MGTVGGTATVFIIACSTVRLSPLPQSVGYRSPSKNAETTAVHGEPAVVGDELAESRRNMPNLWIQRLTCWFRGHHDLCLAAAYGEVRPGGSRKELHYCVRCGRAVWTSSPPDGPWCAHHE
jgi:hypothetical protein